MKDEHLKYHAVSNSVAIANDVPVVIFIIIYYYRAVIEIIYTIKPVFIIIYLYRVCRLGLFSVLLYE